MSCMGPAASSGPKREAATPRLLKVCRLVQDGKRKPSRVEGTFRCPWNVERRTRPKPADGAAELQVVAGTTMLGETCLLQELRGAVKAGPGSWMTNLHYQDCHPLKQPKQQRPGQAELPPGIAALIGLVSHSAGAAGASTYRLTVRRQTLRE